MKKFFRLLEESAAPSSALILNNAADANEHSWLNFGEEEGQLSVDIYQTDDELVIKSTIAGATSKDIDISLVDDMLTIRGRRDPQEDVPNDAYLYRECYWGKFSRSIVLPVEVRGDKVMASLHNGVLTIILPKSKRSKHTNIKVKEAGL
jgi:HSP20 family protein